jgi:hypothetical protein
MDRKTNRAMKLINNCLTKSNYVPIASPSDDIIGFQPNGLNEFVKENKRVDSVYNVSNIEKNIPMIKICVHGSQNVIKHCKQALLQKIPIILFKVGVFA